MLPKQEVVAMLLAGGQGSRLGVLTKKLAKPAVPYGGKYRIIDFPLSNCINSGIETVGVLTQYQPLILNDYIGSGQPWFVVDKDLEHNVLYAAQGKDHPRLYTVGCQASALSWVRGEAPAERFSCSAKFRYRQSDQPVTVWVQGSRCFIQYETPQRAVTPGQFAVLYRGEECLGGGVIDKLYRTADALENDKSECLSAKLD